MKLTNCGITIDVDKFELQRYLAAGYKPVVEDEPVLQPALPQPEPEAVQEPKARKSAKKKG